MAGHSQFKNIMHRKGRQDAAKAKVFTKLIREITTAARLGAADPRSNPRLRAAMIAAREANMTARHDRSGDQARLGRRGRRELRRGTLRGLRPGRSRGDRRGADQQPQSHRRRGALDLRQARRQSRRDQLASPSCSTAWASSAYPLKAGSADEVMEKAIDAGADDVVSGEGEDGAHEIYCAQDNFNAVREALEKSFGQPLSAKLMWRPKTTTPVEGDTAADPARHDRGARRQRRRPERLRQFRIVGRRSGEVRGLTGIDAI